MHDDEQDITTAVKPIITALVEGLDVRVDCMRSEEDVRKCVTSFRCARTGNG